MKERHREDRTLLVNIGEGLQVLKQVQGAHRVELLKVVKDNSKIALSYSLTPSLYSCSSECLKIDILTDICFPCTNACIPKALLNQANE